MKERNNSATGGGVGFVGLLTIVFIVLKLVGVIEWSWWWVLSPVWICGALVLIVLIITAVIAFVAGHKS